MKNLQKNNEKKAAKRKAVPKKHLGMNVTLNASN